LALLSNKIDEKCFVRHYAIAESCSAASWQIFRRKHRNFHDHIKKLPLVFIRFASDGGRIKKH